MSAESKVIHVIEKYHGKDKKQMDVIMSKDKRLVVEAPAGCGKTTTMVSKIAFLLANKAISKNKKILALTFSVNSAYKMKKDIAEKIPSFGLENIDTPELLNKLIYITNYHGLCRRIISLYGYLYDKRLMNINNFVAVNENDYKVDEKLQDLEVEISDDDKVFFQRFHDALINCDSKVINDLENKYCEILRDKFFEKNCITYNGYLILAKHILCENKNLLAFYQKLYPMIIVDEFQDTNILSWHFICLLVNDNTKLLFMGDSLQRIYGFIGAIPNLIDLAKEKFGMTKIEMNRNYRFINNSNMILLEKNIRENARNIIDPAIYSKATISLHYENKQIQESEWIVQNICKIQSQERLKTIAILVQQRGEGIESIIQELDNEQVDFFYALFSDEDEDYIQFHRKALAVFFEELNISKNGRINKTFLNKVKKKISALYLESDRLIESLLALIDVFFDRICTEYRFLENQDKIALISDTLENRALKQNMDLIEANLFISTVHGAKGLEWDYVFIPDFESFCFPNYPSLCGSCIESNANIGNYKNCKLDVSKLKEQEIIEELSVFYVAITRARKELFFSASGERTNAKGKICSSKISCLAYLPGINISEIQNVDLSS